MLDIEKTDVYGFEAAIRGMRNPMNSWDRSDSNFYDGFEIGQNDMKLMTSLRNSGTDHRKFMRMITVYADITGPLYWWKEFDTYKVGTTANSCSTMHRIHSRPFTIEDFSHEHLSVAGKEMLHSVIERLNLAVSYFNATKDKNYWWDIIQLLPSSYNQKRTVMMNYEVLANIYRSRKNHKLDEWHDFCRWIENLPCSQIITGKEITDG